MNNSTWRETRGDIRIALVVTVVAALLVLLLVRLGLSSLNDALELGAWEATQ